MTTPTTPPLGPGRIIGSEWAGRLSPAAGLTDKREWAGERKACPICGHPTGDCTSDGHTEGHAP